MKVFRQNVSKVAERKGDKNNAGDAERKRFEFHLAKSSTKQSDEQQEKNIIVE